MRLEYVADPVRGLRSFQLGLLATAALLALTLTRPASAEYDQSFRFDAESLRVGSLIGAVTVEGHSGSEFLVDIQVRGEDAEAGVLEFDAREGRSAQLMVRFPDGERRYVYPELGRGSRSTFSPNRNGSWWSELIGSDKIEVRGSGNGLELWADITVKVPQGGELIFGNGAGRITASNVDGDLELLTRVGSIEATAIDGSLLADTGSGHVEIDGVRGILLVDTGSGHVDATDVEGDKITIDTGSGHVNLRRAKAPEVMVDTGSGNVEIEGLVSSEVVVDTGSGGVDASDIEADRVEVDTGSGSVTIDLTRMGSGNFVVDTGSGSITFVMPENASAHVEAETGSGGIDVRVADAQMIRDKRDHVEFEVGDGQASVQLDTGSGRIRVASR